MRRILIFVNIVFVAIMLSNYIYYKSLYKKQISYLFELLDRQVQIVGLSVDETNNSFSSDLTKINFTEDLTLFFSDDEIMRLRSEEMKLFYSKYDKFVTGMKFYDNKRNEYTLKKDTESETGDWLENKYIRHAQGEIFKMEKLVDENRKFNYYLPAINKSSGEIIGNIVVTVDFQKYFKEIFTTFNLQNYQWQWVVNDSGLIVYDNYNNGEKSITYAQLENITTSLAEGSVGNIVHNATSAGENIQIISSYYSTQLLQRDLGLVFSAPTAFFQKYIIRNSLFIVIGTLFLIQVIIFIFWRFFKSQKSEMESLKTSERMLFRLIEEMPVGVIIHNKNREIIKANKVAAELYSYESESDMQGKIYPERSFQEGNNYVSSNMAEALHPDQFITIKKEIGEIVLFRKSIPVTFMGVEAIMEILIDVTLLESARKHEAKANVAKSEFLARMSYEIRTPLNGIIGMADVLNKHELSPDEKEIVRLLRRSTEVLLNIINDILDFSKIESGKMILDESPFNLREEINYCIDLAKTNLPQEVNLISRVDDNVPESIIGDPFRLRQILINLMNHSIKNTESGQISLRCALRSRNDGIITLGFELSDTGTAFDKAMLKKIFGDFINMETKVERNSEESSFGAILARQLVELMGGELTAESPAALAKDKGTKVEFTIHTYSNDRISKIIPLEKLNSFDKIRTLVITGSQNRDEDILSALHKMGLSVRVTNFMKQTVSQIKSNLSYPEEKYSLIVIFDEIDFDGFEAARAIFENNLSSHFIMLLISSNDKMGNYMKCVSLGIDSYLIKPFPKSDLVNAVRNSFPFIDDSSASASPEVVRNDLKILVVEDNKMNQMVIGAMLKNLGYSFDVAEDGYAGYLQAKSRNYDLIFMDLVMPEMDGFEASKRIIETDKKVIIIAFTADNMPETRRKAELSGIRDFISKPVRIDDLRKLFARHFKK